MQTDIFSRKGLKVSVLDDGLEVVEPDVLVDISSLAACFQDYSHHPLAYLINRLKPSANTQPILLGNFAGTALDNIIHQPDADFGNMLRTSFSEQALQFCTCEGFQPAQFKADGQKQVANIRETVDKLFGQYDRERVLLEPSFVCRTLGLKGRIDLMTNDMRLLVEQKSGKLWGSYKEAHYVQVLLYYSMLRYNFQLAADHVDIWLLYSKYPASEGLLPVTSNDQLFRQAIQLRNDIVAMEINIARQGFATVLPLLQPNVLLQRPQRADFYNRYIRPQIERLVQPLHQLSASEQDYVERMMTFVYREQMVQQTAPATDDDYRRGDMIYLYRKDGDPDVCHHILYKGVIERLDDNGVTVWLVNSHHAEPVTFSAADYAFEHATSEKAATTALRSLAAFCQARQDKRDLLLGQRTPRQDTSLTLSRSYHPAYDDILLRAKQARDYFLLQGPPGTGKTSLALRFLVEEECNAQLLLTAYTHRAVDEICAMLEDAGQDYLLLGSAASCDPRFAHRLLSPSPNEGAKLSLMQRRLHDVHIVVSTTLTLQTRPFILELKHFSLCIVDEASQLLEPTLIGLLASSHIDRFILIGDHKQLPAVVQQPDDEPRLHHCRLSLFERLLRQEREAGRTAFTGVLNRQGRMHPDIAQFPNELFYNREQLMPVPCPHQLETALDYQQPSEDELDDLLKQRRVLFLNLNAMNMSEETLVADLLRRIYRQVGAAHFDTARTVGIIVTYRRQIALLRRELTRLSLPALLDVSIDTVERYQGSQRDIIIYALGVDTTDQLDFLTAQSFEEDGHTIDRKLNVAMTRARKQLLLVGRQDVLGQNAIFRTLMQRYSV